MGLTYKKKKSIVNGIDLLLSFSDCSLLVYRNKIYFYIHLLSHILTKLTY